MNILKILDGKKLADELLDTQHIELSPNVRRPYLVVITIGDNDASNVYVRNKRIACEKCDITFGHKVFEESTSVEDVINYIKRLNTDKTVDGIIVQQPVPYQFKGIEQLVDPHKDVDGFTTQNIGGIFNGTNYVPACTPNGIMQLLHYNDISVVGKHIVILGRSNIVGKPLIGMLLNANATVTSCNSHTKDLEQITKTADIIISAIGKPKFLNRKHITPKCECIIDVGINRDENNKICGDVNFNDIIDYWESLDDDTPRSITPVPGGVGPMTVYSLIKNVNTAYCENVIRIITE